MEQGPGPFQKQCFGWNRIHGDGDHLLRTRLVDPSMTFGQIRKSARNPGQRARPFIFAAPEDTGRAPGWEWLRAHYSAIQLRIF